MLTEHAWDRKFGEPLPTLEDVMKEQTVKFKDKDGKDHEIDMDTAKHYAADIKGGDSSDYKKAAVKAAGLDKDTQDGEKEEPKSKGLEPDDFERDFDDDSKTGGEPESGDDVDKLIKQISSKGISDDEWDNVPPKAKKAFRSKVTKIYSTMKKLSDNEEYDKLEKMEKKFGMQLWQAKGLYDEFVEGDDGEPEDKPHGGDTGTDADFQGEPPEGAREPDDSDDDKPDSSVARKKLAKMSRKELAKTEYPFDDDDNYLGSDDYDPEEDAHSAPDLDGLEDVDRTTLKQKYMDVLAHRAQMEYDMEDAESQDDSDWEEESRDNFEAAVKNQNKILQLLKPQMPTVGMGGRSTRGGIGIRDSVEINGKKYKKVKEHVWDRKFGEPLPTLTDVMKKKVTKKHILRETYERIGGK